MRLRVVQLALAMTAAILGCNLLIGGLPDLPDGAGADGIADVGGDADSGIPNVPAQSIAAGVAATCAVRVDGTVACWGDGPKLGAGGSVWHASSTPVLVSGLNDATQVSVGYSHACAVRKTGDVVCWGTDGYGELGNDLVTDSTVPVAVQGLGPALAVAAGWSFSCAIKADGTAACWGGNGTVIGDGYDGGGPQRQLVPAAVTGLSNLAGITAGPAHICAYTTTGDLYCWGSLSSGASAPTPVKISGISGVVGMATDDHFDCAITSDGSAWCWGDNTRGDLGNGSGTTSSVPVKVSLVTNAKTIGSGEGHACVLEQDGSVMCW